MITKVIGKIVSDAVNKSRVNPQPIKDSGNRKSGEQTNSQVTFINTGNVPQVIRITGVLNVVNCVIISGHEAVDVEILPGDSYSHDVIFKLYETPIASDPIDFSFDVDYEWLD